MNILVEQVYLMVLLASVYPVIFTIHFVHEVLNYILNKDVY